LAESQFALIADFSNYKLNTLASGCFRGFSRKKTPKRMWFCMGIFLL